MAENFKAALILAAISFMAVSALYGQKLKNENQRLAYEANAFKRESAYLKHELQLNFKALEAREAEQKRLAEEKSALAKELEKYYDMDCQARAWADTACPPGVIERLRR